MHGQTQVVWTEGRIVNLQPAASIHERGVQSSRAIQGMQPDCSCIHLGHCPEGASITPQIQLVRCARLPLEGHTQISTGCAAPADVLHGLQGWCKRTQQNLATNPTAETPSPFSTPTSPVKHSLLAAQHGSRLAAQPCEMDAPASCVVDSTATQACIHLRCFNCITQGNLTCHLCCTSHRATMLYTPLYTPCCFVQL